MYVPIMCLINSEIMLNFCIVFPIGKQTNNKVPFTVDECHYKSEPV